MPTFARVWDYIHQRPMHSILSILGVLGLLGNSPLYQLHYKVAANTAQGTQSDFVPGENTSITPG